MKKLIYLALTILIVACSSDDEGNSCLNEPTLTTLAVSNITETSATLNGAIENCEDPTNTEQGFVYATTTQPTTNNIQVNVNGTNISTSIENLNPNTTYYVRTFLTIEILTIEIGELYGNEVSFTTINDEPSNCNIVYLANNGLTIKACDSANIGDTGVINGVTYTVVDESLLRDLVANEEDVTKLATTKVTDMSALFFLDPQSINFNQNISNWDVSNVTGMNNMFNGAATFNQPIGDWDVSNVNDMNNMFSGATAFNQPIGDWDVSNVSSMNEMFDEATAFNQPIGDWNVSNVINMQGMFNGSSFNQPIGDWDVSNVTMMDRMFYNTPFNKDIGNWDVSNVKTMSSMFSDATAFNQPIGNWNVSNVEGLNGMSSMFSDATAFNQPIGNWDVSNVSSMYTMFNSATSFNQPIGDWDVSNVEGMSNMFRNTSFNQNIQNWDVSDVKYMGAMFKNNTAFNQNLNSWNVNNVTFCYEFSLNTPQWTLPKPNLPNSCID